MSRRWSELEVELTGLRQAFQATVNRLWDLKLSLQSAYRNGHQDKDFLPRRLRVLDEEETTRLRLLLDRLQELLGYSRDLPVALASDEEREALQSIHRILRYLKNAYASETSLACSLTRFDRSLPALSRP
ncbi:MAG TPA: hypothetical protein VJR29_07010 [bacterium]|nr:hypothetical protein [bacterium]